VPVGATTYSILLPPPSQSFSRLANSTLHPPSFAPAANTPSRAARTPILIVSSRAAACGSSEAL
jgi:hypothetical protein